MQNQPQNSKKNHIAEVNSKLDANAYIDLKFQILDQKIGGIIDSKIRETIYWFAAIWSIAITVVIASITYQAWGWIKTSTSEKIERAFLEENIQKTVEAVAIKHAKLVTENYITSAVAEKLVPLERKVSAINASAFEAERLTRKIKPLEEKILELNEKASLVSGKIDVVEEYAKKDMYRPLSPQIKQKIIKGLPLCGIVKEITIDTVNANNSGLQLREDLLLLFKDAKIPAQSGETSSSFGSVRESGVIIMGNEKTFPTIEKLSGLLQEYIHIIFQFQLRYDYADGVIRIQLLGEPLFRKDGSIE